MILTRVRTIVITVAMIGTARTPTAGAGATDSRPASPGSPGGMDGEGAGGDTPAEGAGPPREAGGGGGGSNEAGAELAAPGETGEEEGEEGDVDSLTARIIHGPRSQAAPAPGTSYSPFPPSLAGRRLIPADGSRAERDVAAGTPPDEKPHCTFFPPARSGGARNPADLPGI